MNQLNQLATNLSVLAKNPHVSISLILAGACEVGKIWVPAHATQFDATQKALSYYAVLAASTSGPSKPDPNLS